MAKEYRKKGFVVATQDEATFGLIPTVARGWARKGSRPVTTMNYQHKWTNVFGARTKRSFVFLFRKRKKARCFVELMQLLHKRWSKVCLFVDSAPCHKGKLVERFLSSHKKTFILIRFPKYSPELNPIEQCWKPARKILANRFIPSLSAAKYHLQKVFTNHSLLPKMFGYLSD